MKRVSIIITALIAVVVLGGCKEKKNEVVALNKPLVKTMAATKGSVEQLVTITGAIEPFVENVICPSAPGRIDRILVKVGDKVGASQLLVKMDPYNYNQAAVQLSQLEIDHQRLENVLKENGIPQQQVESHKVQLEMARTVAKNLRDNVELRSPISGIVTGKYYDQGDMFTMAPSGGVIGVLTIMQIDRLKVIANISEQYFPRITSGMVANIGVDIFTGETFEGKVSLIYPAIDPATRTFTVEITIPNGNLKLRPGMFSRITLNLGNRERVLAPDIAVLRQTGTNERYVWVVNSGVVERKSVTVGRQIGDQVEIIDGLSEGDQTIIAGASKVVGGMEVELTD